MLIRSIGSALRGNATRSQVFLAAFLAGLLGFVPGFFLPGDVGGGFAQSPGLILGLLFLVLVLNANTGIFGLCLLVAKLLSLPLIGVSFAIGRVLLDGPTRPLFQALINSRVTAWFGLEYYATSGGLVLGAVFGGAVGWSLARTITAIRTHMAGVEENSERYQKWSKKRSVKILSWAFLGKGKGKASWQDLTAQKRGLPIRIWGAGLVVVIAAGLYVFQSFYATPLLTSAARSGLTLANGATVDVQEARLDLGAGNLQITGLAMADKNALDTDVFRAGTLQAKVDTGELLRKRLVIDTLKSSDASSGQKRATPGTLTPTPPEPPPPPPAADSKTLDDYIKDAKVWKERLDQVREWLKKLSGDGQKPSETSPGEVDKQVQHQKEIVGAARVVATHLIEGSPKVLIRHIDIEGITLAQLPGETLDLHGAFLSTAPSLVTDPATLSVKTRSDKLKLELGAAAATGSLGLDFAFKGLPVDAVFSQFKLAGAAPVHGGTIDLASKGSFKQAPGAAAVISLPLEVTMLKTTFELGGKATPVDNLVLPVSVHGALASPTIGLDDKALSAALVKAGKAELANFVNGQAGKLLGGKLPGVDAGKSVQENVDAAKKKAEDEAKQKLLDEAKKKGLDLKGLLPGGKKDDKKQ